MNYNTAMPILLPEPPTAAKTPAIAQRAVAKALNYLAKQWDLSGAEIGALLHLPGSTINDWRAKSKVPMSFNAERLEARAELLLHLLASQRSLESMFANAEDQRAWLRTKHPDFGIPPLEFMQRSIESLIFMRRYLDYVRGRGA